MVMIGKDNPTGALGANCVHFFQQARLERGAAGGVSHDMRMFVIHRGD